MKNYTETELEIKVKIGKPQELASSAFRQKVSSNPKHIMPED